MSRVRLTVLGPFASVHDDRFGQEKINAQRNLVCFPEWWVALVMQACSIWRGAGSELVSADKCHSVMYVRFADSEALE